MTPPRNPDWLIRAFLAEGQDELPDQVYDAVRDRIEQTNQRVVIGPWRTPFMNRFVAIGLGAAVVMIAAFIGIQLLGGPNVLGQGPAEQPAPTVTPVPRPTPVPSPVPADVVRGPLNPGSVRTVTIQGISMTFTVSGAGWEAHGRPYVSKSSAGPQGAEAILYWASFPEGMSAEPCSVVIGPTVGSSAADLADAISTAPGTELVAGPSEATLGGLPALAVVVAIRSEMGCDPGYFYSWEPFTMGAMWPAAGPGTTIRVWIVDVDRTLVFIAAATHSDVDARVEGELQQIVDSIQFE